MLDEPATITLHNSLREVKRWSWCVLSRRAIRSSRMHRFSFCPSDRVCISHNEVAVYRYPRSSSSAGCRCWCAYLRARAQPGRVAQQELPESVACMRGRAGGGVVSPHRREEERQGSNASVFDRGCGVRPGVSGAWDGGRGDRLRRRRLLALRRADERRPLRTITFVCGY